VALHDIADQLASAAREMSSEGDVGQTLDKSVALAVDMISGCDAAAVSLVHRGKRLETPAYTDDSALRSDELQYELGEGPCMDAAWREELIRSRDLMHEDRWPIWAPRVVEEFGARSMLCVQLFTTGDSLGALNMYSRSVDGFAGEDDEQDALALAAHISVALRAAQQVEQLTSALERRTVIGQAEGILMERFDMPADRAFAVLRRVSSTSNTKLHEVAQTLIRTRETPG
jgi:GAF domain-containing protein